MQFYDIVALKEEIDLKQLAHRFGYAEIFLVGKDAEIVSDVKRLNEEGSFIVRSGNNETLSKAVRSNSVIGVIVDDSKVSGKFIEELRTHEKLLFIPAAPLVCPAQENRLRNLFWAKGILRTALMGKAKVALVTLASEKECLLSSGQMLEIAKLLGANEKIAKEMLSSLGGPL
jgi:hypothetical protein